MPTIRGLAETLTVNPNTVARAYRELETEGIVEKRRTAGTYVAESGPRLSRTECLKILTERIDALLSEAKQMEIGTQEIVDLIQQRNQLMSPGDKAR